MSEEKPDNRSSVPAEELLQESTAHEQKSAQQRGHQGFAKSRKFASKEAVEIGRELGENRRGPFLEIERGIELFGITKIRTLVARAVEIYLGEGMPVESGERLRTLGGIFFYLLRGEIYGARLGWPKKPRSATLEDCRKVADAMVAQGDLRSVVLTLTGRPESVREEKGIVVVLLRESRVPSSIPKLLPPVREANTTFAVYVAAKQWKKVASALEQDPDDTLVIEGYPKCELKLDHIEVYAIMVTTKGMIRRAGEARRASALPSSVPPSAQGGEEPK